MKTLIVRNDKLGDFVLTLPCYALLKSALPDTHIAVFVPDYTAEIARCCPYIDQVIIDPSDGSLSGIYKLAQHLHSFKFDAVITLFSTTRVGLAALLAGIRYRLAPATKIAQIFYNHRLSQRRSRSEQPESAYNLDLIRKYLGDHAIEPKQDPKPPYLNFDAAQIEQLKQTFCKQNKIDAGKKIILLHAGHGGSANNLNLPQYARLAELLNQSNQYSLVLTAGPAEEHSVKSLSDMLPNTPHIIFQSTQGLAMFAQHIAFADVFIAGSTGTLHIAGALNVPTAAFYTRRRSATSLRWQTLNSPERRLAFSPPMDASEEDMQSIDIGAAAQKIRETFLEN